MSDTPTPRTDSLMEEWHHCPPTKQLLNHSRKLERELAEAKENGIAWEMAALKCGLYRADVPHSTPEKWQASQASAACALLDQLAGMKAQLTAHKAALNLCQMALNADNHETYLELKAEALSEIAKLKGTK